MAGAKRSLLLQKNRQAKSRAMKAGPTITSAAMVFAIPAGLGALDFQDWNIDEGFAAVGGGFARAGAFGRVPTPPIEKIIFAHPPQGCLDSARSLHRNRL